MSRPVIFLRGAKFGVGACLGWTALYVIGWWFIYKFTLAQVFGADVDFGSFQMGAYGICVVGCVLAAVLLANTVVTDDRAAGHNAFLAKLPISAKRLIVEKVSSGIVSMVALYLVCITFMNMIGVEVMRDHAKGSAGYMDFGTLESNLALAMGTAYLFGILVGRITDNTVTILMVALGLEIMLWWLVAIIVNENFQFSELGTLFGWILIFTALPAAAVWQKWQLTVPVAMWGRAGASNGFQAFVWQGIANNIQLVLGSVFIFIFAWWYVVTEGRLETNRIVGEGVTNSAGLVSTISYLLVAALGTSAYSVDESRGGLLQRLPLSRATVLTARVLGAILPISLCAYAVSNISTSIPFLPILLAAIFIYCLAICISFATSNVAGGLLLTLAWSVMSLWAIAGWMTPVEFPLFSWGFQPVGDPWVVALIPLTLKCIVVMALVYLVVVDNRLLTMPPQRREKMILWLILAMYVVVATLTRTGQGLLEL